MSTRYANALSNYPAAEAKASECLRWLLDQDPAKLDADKNQAHEFFIKRLQQGI